MIDDRFENDRIQRLAGTLRDVPQQIQQHDAAGGKRERCRHVEHRPFAGRDARFGERVDVVRHRFQAGVGAAALRISEQYRRHHENPAGLAREARGLVQRFGNQRRQAVRVRVDAITDKHHVHDHEADEDRQQEFDRLFHAAQVERHEQYDRREFDAYLVAVQAERQQAEHRIGAAGNRYCNRQHVVDDERRAGHEAGMRAEQIGGDLVAAAAVRKELDDLVVRERDDEDGDRDRDREIKAEVRVAAQRQERFFRPVTRRRQAVRAETDPRKKCDQRDVLARIGIERIERRAGDQSPQILRRGHRAASSAALCAGPCGGDPVVRCSRDRG